MSYPVQNQNQESSDSYEAQLRKMQEEYNGTGGGSDYNSDLEGNDPAQQDQVQNVDPGFLSGNYGMKVIVPGMKNGKPQPLTVDALRAQLNDLESKIKASADLSDKQKDYILNEIEDEMSQVNYAVSETGDAQQTTLTDVKTAMGDISSAMTGAPKADDLIKQIDDLTKQCDDAKVPSASQKDLETWKENLGKMKSQLELDPSDANQKAAQDLIKQVTSDLKKATDAQAAADKAAAKIPDDMMKKLTGMSGGKLDETYILDRMYEVFGKKYDYNGDGKISRDEFDKAVTNKDFPPSAGPDLLKFLYKIDTNLQDDLQAQCVDQDVTKVDFSPVRDDLIKDLKALYPDQGGIGPVPGDMRGDYLYFDGKKVCIDGLPVGNHPNPDDYQDGKSWLSNANPVDLLVWN